MLFRVSSVLAATALVAGCGGSDYRADEIRSCMASWVGELAVSDEVDFIAASAEVSFVARFGQRNRVTMTLGDADRIEESYRLAAESFGVSPDGMLDRRGDLVIAWDERPDDYQRVVLERCLG